MRKTLYQLISDTLRTLPAIQHIDLWNNQVLYAEEEQPFPTPAVFVEFAPVEWQHLLHGVKEAVLTLRLHVVTDSRVSPWSEAVEVFALHDHINATLHGLHATTADGSVVDALTLTQSTTDHDFAELQDNVEVYQCHVTDRSAYRR